MATSYLTRTQTTGDQKTWTFSAWVKRGEIATNTIMSYASSASNNPRADIAFNSDDILFVGVNPTGLTWYEWKTTAKFRDCNGWYHVVVSMDTTQAVDTDRLKIYVNGVAQTFSGTLPTEDFDTGWNVSGNVNAIGRYQQGGTYYYWTGLMSNIVFVDGLAYGPTEFGEVDSTSGIWKFKAPAGLTYGTNGFWLKGENSGALGTDSSGEANTFAVAAGTPTQAIDTPSNVMATLNPNYQSTFHATSRAVLANGNTKWTGTSDSTSQNGIISTIGASKGKFYLETKFIGTWDALLGVAKDDFGMMTAGTGGLQSVGWYGLMTNLSATGGAGMTWYTNNSATGDKGSTLTSGDIIMMAIDIDNNFLYFGRNGTWEESGDPTSGATGTGATSTLASDTTYLVACSNYGYNIANSFEFNFGNGYFGTTVISSAGTSSTGDDSIWEYDCPTGYYGLNTKNINTYG